MAHKTDRETAVRDAFRKQIKAATELGSPFVAHLCRLFAERLDHGTAVGRAVLDWPGDASINNDIIPLRLAGSLHALVLSSEDKALKAVYPPNETDDDRLWHALLNAFEKHADFITERLQSAPQTNEIRRCNALLPGFLTIADLFGKPLDLLEVGASAGLNLQWDRYHYDLGGFEWGDPASPVHLKPDWQGPLPPDAEITIASRLGCDLNPLDVTSEDDRLRLKSYVWADQPDRMQRLDAALMLAVDNPPPVERADALEWLPRELVKPPTGAVRVVYHSIAWQYLPAALRARGEATIAEAGKRATKDQPLARLQMEADDRQDGATISLQIWPTGEIRELGRVDFHGRWVKWKGWW
ncbi:hypothetical protein J2T09_000844 [Neorhizobium huautlense]|uniref:DUF2332 domain-containing protein n=1 Tax=Neorhizobium huautlense TaxID=67774 RepID=A0ABT9PNP9_9HYPH|nr:DUF2332 family protein [Neorhizobium huautlense]MDP9836102.1 hypothetical protein [Neorhizobium huautlense]